ncbi:unnamed protein product [Musa acuminata subsp. malaccensis]|uniref:(wild Malaysian banana) hypothetical protein n=1 Tax=Musa acuminata subsp. malaccensis TaxID=214687 RepID=A0A804HQI8_MUSAM|nr:unnamed protein product [Musa acuminata subsp. malaccensis]
MPPRKLVVDVSYSTARLLPAKEELLSSPLCVHLLSYVGCDLPCPQTPQNHPRPSGGEESSSATRVSSPRRRRGSEGGRWRRPGSSSSPASGAARLPGSGCAPWEGAWTAVSPPGSRSSRMRKISSRRAGASGSSSKCRKESPWRSRAKSPKSCHLYLQRL